MTYDSLPNRHREFDENEGFPQRTFLEAYEEELDQTRFKVRGVLDQRDPNKAIASDSAFTIDIDTSSVVVDDFWGESVLVEVSVGEDITTIGPGWICTVTSSSDANDIRAYKVLRVRTRNEPETRNEILLRGVPEVLLNTEVVLRPPSMLNNLAKDHNVIIDDEEPIQFQRSAVANAVALRSIKSNEQSYSIRGDMAGFDVTALGLWRIPDPVPADLPSPNVFELPSGSGKFYTTIDPRNIKFDEIAGDIEFDDPDLGVISMVDFELLFADSSGDNLSPASAFAENVLEGFFTGFAAEPTTITVSAVTAVTDPDVVTAEGVTPVPVFDGIETDFALQLVNTLITPGSLTLDTSAGAGSEDFTDSGNGNLIGDGGGSGTIDYETGAITLSYAVAPAGGLVVGATYTWDALRVFELPNADRVTTNMTPGQRLKIGQFTKGKFILVSVADGSEYFIEQEDLSVFGSIGFIVSVPTPPDTGAYTLKYLPSIEPSCFWCRANVMVIQAEATAALVSGFNGSGDKVNAAFLRLGTKLNKLVPVHVRLGAFIQKIVAPVSGPTLSVTATVTET